MTALEKLRVAPTASFNITDWTIDIIFIVVIGGIGSLEGPILGAIIFFALRQWLADFGAWYLILLGILSIGVILFEPRGVWGAFRRWGVPDLLPSGHAPEHLVQTVDSVPAVIKSGDAIAPIRAGPPARTGGIQEDGGV